MWSWKMRWKLERISFSVSCSECPSTVSSSVPHDFLIYDLCRSSYRLFFFSNFMSFFVLLLFLRVPHSYYVILRKGRCAIALSLFIFMLYIIIWVLPSCTDSLKRNGHSNGNREKRGCSSVLSINDVSGWCYVLHRGNSGLWLTATSPSLVVIPPFYSLNLSRKTRMREKTNRLRCVDEGLVVWAAQKIHPFLQVYALTFMLFFG